MQNQFQFAFHGSALDRCANRRKDKAWLKSLLDTASTRYLHMSGDKTILVNENLLTDKILTENSPSSPEKVFLGIDEVGIAWFTGRTTITENLMDIRSLALAGTLPPPQLALLAQARAMLSWHERNGYCANCGNPTYPEDAGYRRHCLICATDHFPRTDPVAIISVHYKNRYLLGRQRAWPAGMYSTLAGFMEPGETIEEAARREVFEESGITVGKIEYHSSQPWPFPSNLMIGLKGEAITQEINLDTEELEAAQWFTKDEVIQMLKGTHPQGFFAPSAMAIAHHLIRASIEDDC